MRLRRSQGFILIYEVIVMFIFSFVLVSVLATAHLQIRSLRSSVAREQALQIAEAGVNYYQWHLAHFPTDFQDGTGGPGPYVHDYLDKDTNQKIGEFSLQITPPPVGSTVVTIQSTGYTLKNPNQKRIVTVRYGIPSLAKFAFLTNTDVWIGDTEHVSGEFHANGGIRFDGTGNAPITSAKQTYLCQPYHGCSPPLTKPGIWGGAPAQTQAFWQFPVPNVDFSSITSDLAAIKNKAQTSGIYLPPSNAQGYSLVFNNTGTVSVYKVISLRAHPTGWDVNGRAHSEDIDYRTRVLQFTSNLPQNGLIFMEDRVWVEGIVNGRALVAAAKFPYNPNTAPSIIIPNTITYLQKDGNHSLGLIAQKDFLISYYAPANLEINGAIIAQNGSAQRYYFPGNLKTTITIYGSVSSFGVWTWSWVNGSGTVVSGYQTTYTTYDTNLLYAPPPSFPLSAEGYKQLSWTSN